MDRHSHAEQGSQTKHTLKVEVTVMLLEEVIVTLLVEVMFTREITLGSHWSSH